MKIAPPARPTKIVSFGYKHGDPPTGSPHSVADIRRMFRNPYSVPALRPLTGKDAEVKLYMLEDPHFLLEYRELYRHIEKGPEVLYIGCTGGQHRSVYIADRLGLDFGIPVEHRDLKVTVRQESKK